MRYICTTIVATLVLAGTSFAATINVPGDHATIQGAIDASSDGDVIAIAAGIYNEANLNPGGKAITIQGTLNGDGSLATTIDAQQQGSVFLINSNEGPATIIQDLVITGGTGAADHYLGGSLNGGGVAIFRSSSPTIVGCTITGNTAYLGGGICSATAQFTSNTTITNCTISDNTAGFGGGIYTSRSLTITTSEITSNTSDDSGGGILVTGGTITMTDCMISKNASNWGYGGGGIRISGGYIDISQCTFSNNASVRTGGGADFTGCSGTVTDCTFASNTANSYGGGGVYLLGSYLTFTNNIIKYNTSNGTSGDGGGIWSWNGTSSFHGCDIQHNTAGTSGGGLYINGGEQTFLGCSISNNSSVMLGGGARFRNSEIEMSECAIANNECLDLSGGGLHLTDANGTITDCDIINNTTLHEGAGMDVSGTGTLILQNSRITGNLSGGNGAGAHIGGGLEAIVNCTFSDNQAGGAGGGLVFWSAGDSLIYDCVIKNNLQKCCSASGAIQIFESDVSLSDSTLCGNGENQINGPIADLGGNQILDVCFNCPGDATFDDSIDVSDLLKIISLWGTNDPTADFDDSGIIDILDLLAVISAWGNCP